VIGEHIWLFDGSYAVCEILLWLTSGTQDPSGPTPDKRDVDDGEKVGGKAASGVDEPADDGDEKEAGGMEEEEEEEEEEETVDPKEKLEEGVSLSLPFPSLLLKLLRLSGLYSCP